MTFTDSFRKNIFSNFNDNSLYTKKNPIRCCKNIKKILILYMIPLIIKLIIKANLLIVLEIIQDLKLI